MKRALRSIIIASIVFLAILIAGASMTIAFPSSHDECGDCHTNSSTLTISSNATGTVDAELNKAFTLTIDAGGYSGGDQNFYVSIEPTWADNNQFTFTTTSIEDNGAGDLNSNLNEISISVAFTPISIGTYTIRIWTAANDNLATSLDVIVSVTVNDDTAPVIDSPGDQVISQGDPLANITWTPTDAYPDRYEVYDDEVSWLTGSWDGSPILIALNSLTIGLHNITLAVYDIGDNVAWDQVDIEVVDDTPPVIGFVGDMEVSEGAPVWLTWSVTELNPSHYEIFQDEVSIDSGVWDGSDVSIPLSVLGLGQYNFTLFVNDTSGLSDVSQVNVDIVDGTAPTVNSPDDITMFETQPGFSIIWTPSDAHPDRYEIRMNGSLIRSGDWNFTGESVTFSLDGLTINYYIYTFTAFDVGNNFVSDNVSVTVLSAIIPYLNSPDDLEVSEGSIGIEVTWNPFDLNPQGYEIYVDSVLLRSGPWNSSGEVISVIVDASSLGLYNFTAYVFDTDGNNATDTVWVTVFDGTSPTISPPDDVEFDEGQTGFDISWTPSDLHPASYLVFKNGVEIKSGAWNSSSESITVSLDGLALGVYNYTIAVVDIGGNPVSDEVSVSVIDGTFPILDSPSDIEYEQLTTSHSISWNPSDLHPVSYSILRNGTVVNSGGWNGSAIFILVDWLMPGTYYFTLVVTDIGGNSVYDTVMVIVTPSTVPTEPTTTTTTTTMSETTTTPPPPPILEDPVLAPFVLVVGTWLALIFIVVVISEVLLRKGKW